MPPSSEHSDSDSSVSTTSSSSDSSSSSSSDSSETSKTQDVPPSKKNEKEKKQKLLDDSSSDEGESSGEEEGDASANAPAKSTFKVNQKYAREFDQRKRREELLNARQAGENLGSDGDDDDDSSSEEEDEDGELMTPGMDLSILRTLKALKNKDETIYNKNARFFPAEDDDDGSDDDDGEGKKRKKSKPMKYKDVVREQVLEQMDAEERGEGDKGGDSDDEGGNAASRRHEDEDGPASRFAYDDEQRELRAAFLKSTNSDDDDDDNDDNSGDNDGEGDDWMVKKSASKADAGRAQKLVENEISELEKLGTGDASVSDPRGEVGDGDKFLLDFIKNKRWVDKDLHGSDEDSDEDDNEERGIYRSKMNNGDDDGDEDGRDSDASLDELEQMDAFESKYNFRFEEAAASAKAGESGAAYSVVGYARGGAHTTDTLRRKDETRKQKRLARNEKKAAERKAKEERLRRLKNAKREELEGRVKQVRQVVGAAEEGDADIDEAALMKLMEGDFDPDKFEAIMSKTYGDDFYDKEDAEWKNDVDVKQSLMRDETGAEGDIINEDTGGMYDEYNDEEEAGGDEDGDDEDPDFDPEPPADFEEETGIEKKLRNKMEDELYKLDYEDIIGDMPTRFKYRKVEANRFGLMPQEILFAKDSTLKQFVSLKRMAPYSEGEEYLPGTKKRKRFRDIAKHDYEELMEAEPEAEAEHVQESAAAEDAGDVDKPKKKRRRQKKKKKGADTTDTDTPPKEKMEDAAKENASKEKAEKKDKQSSTDLSEATSDAKADAKKKRRQKKNKDGKSGSKKKKASKIAGVAESRLAAYGL